MMIYSCAPNLEEKVDQIFSPYTGENIPGAAVMIIQDGNPILQKTYGMANLEKEIPVSTKTNFRLASVSKQFIAMCTLMLIEAKKLDYSTTLVEIFSDFPEYGKTITILNLLQHTSGLVAYEDLIPDSATVQVTDTDVLQMMMEQDSTYFPPGTSFRYSNSGYAVLAKIVEKISGISFAKFLKKNIFDPVGMNNTVAYQKGISELPNRAFGYTVSDDSISFSDQSLTSAVLGDGGIYSSIEDLYNWDQTLFTNKLVRQETLNLAFTPNLEIYGFGWRIDEYKGHSRVHHTGSTCGFRNVIQRFPIDHFTVIILTNRRDPDVALLAEKLVDLYLIEK
jgi:CubicO group peptidase (beta-lactamase class C family)